MQLSVSQYRKILRTDTVTETEHLKNSFCSKWACMHAKADSGKDILVFTRQWKSLLSAEYQPCRQCVNSGVCRYDIQTDINN